MQTNRVGIAYDYLQSLCRGAATPSPPDCSPESRAAAEQARRILLDCQRRLTPRQATIVWLHHYEGRTLADISITLEMSEDAVRHLHQRARRVLREELEARGILRISDIL